MLTVVTSTATPEHLQVDGSFWVTELHTLSDGSQQQFYYLAAPEADYNSICAQRAADINASLNNGSS